MYLALAYRQLEKISDHFILSSSKSLITAIPSTESPSTPNVIFLQSSTTSNPASWRCAHRPHPSFFSSNYIYFTAVNE